MSQHDDDLELLADLEQTLDIEKFESHSPEQARIIAGFEDILAFVADNGREPQHGPERDIFERLYAIRLERLRAMPSAIELLRDLDAAGLLAAPTETEGEPDDEVLLKDLGLSSVVEDITNLRHVTPAAHRNAAEDVASRKVCREFEKFQPIFERVISDLSNGARVGRERIVKEDFKVGNTFIVGGQLAYIAKKGEEFPSTSDGDMDARLRVIYDNGTESEPLMRSLQRALNKDERGRVVSIADAGPLFSDATENETGTIYVLRSLSEAPNVLPFRDAMVKIGVTGQDVKRRIANAEREATYLLAPVEIVDTYTLYNVNRNKLEKMLKQVFASSRIELSVPDRFGDLVKPSEWFLIPPGAVAEAVEFIRTGEISRMEWSKDAVRFIARSTPKD